MAADTRHVLIVKDDDTTRRAMLAFFAEQQGFSPITVRTMTEALEALDESLFDIVVTGDTLKDGNGHSMYEAVRKHVLFDRRRTRVVFYTGYPAWYLRDLKRIPAGDQRVRHVRPTEGGLPALLAAVNELLAVPA